MPASIPQDIEPAIDLVAAYFGTPTDEQWKEIALACLDQAGVSVTLQEEIAEHLGIEPLGVIRARDLV